MRTGMRRWVVVAAVWMSVAVAAVQAGGRGGQGADQAAGRQMGAGRGQGAGIPAAGPAAAQVAGPAAGVWLPPWLTDAERAEWQNGLPPGWTQGEKVGWRGAGAPPGLVKKPGGLPPGLAKKSFPGWDRLTDEQKAAWNKELGEARAAVQEKGRKLKLADADVDSALVSLEAAARAGAPVKNVRSLVEQALDKGVRGRDLETATRAMAYGVGKEVDFDQLGKFVTGKLDEGVRGDDLAVSIYKEVAARHEEKLKAKEAVQPGKEKGKAD